jgi:hypothetical protein
MSSLHWERSLLTVKGLISRISWQKPAQSALFAAKMPQRFSLIQPSGMAVAE